MATGLRNGVAIVAVALLAVTPSVAQAAGREMVLVDAVKSGDVLAEVETDKAIMELVARGEQQVACMKLEGGKVSPAPVPRQLRDALSAALAFDAGVRANDSAVAGARAVSLRDPSRGRELGNFARRAP